MLARIRLVLVNVVFAVVIAWAGADLLALDNTSDDEYAGCCRFEASGSELPWCCAATGPGACDCNPLDDEMCNHTSDCPHPE